MKLWDKGYEPDKMIETFTVGNDRELDLRLARYDVEGSMAHIRMLESIGLIGKEELPVLLAGLEEIRQEILDGQFTIEEGIEDVHSQVELLLTQRLGDVGKKIPSGRSRNDQVLLDLKLFTRAQLREITEEVLREYLPEVKPNLPMLAIGKASHGKTFESERDILYQVLFDMRQDMAELTRIKFSKW